MQIKQYDKQGVVAWSNSKVHSELLASASFQEENDVYNLDILSLDLQERSKKINVIGNGYADSPFRCIAWDNFGEKQNLYSHGLIFTGMDDNSFKLWNPAEMIATYPTRPAPSRQNIEQQPYIIYEEALDSQFPIMCAEWNSLNNNILAFGTTDVFILILNKGQATDPDLRKPGKKNPHHGSYVTSVSWNRQVAHILASASQNGLVALWDIKTNNSIFQFRDSGASTSGNRNVEICWSKSISTQIAVTLDDEKHNQLQIWDLRNQKGPVVVIDKFHSKGINAMDWCETDPELILTSSRDKKIACWNYTQEEEPLSQTTLQSQTVSVKWSKKLPSIYSVSTDDKTFVYTLNDANLFSYVPKWYKVPVGSTILGNESILTYSQKRGNILNENRLVDHNKKSIIRPKLKVLAGIAAHQEEQESDLLNLLKAKNAEGSDIQIYDYLGFNKGKIVQEVEKYTGKKREFAAPNQKEKTTKPKPKAYTQIQGQDALAFFASINNQSFDQSAKNDEDQNNERVQYDMVPRNFNWDLGKEKIVKQNILIGNYQGAIDAALKCGRTAEALIIAYSVDQNLFNNTLKTFFTQTTDSFITDVLKHIAYKDALELVKKYDLNKWKECIALIFSIAGRDKRPQLLKVLAGRLRAQSAQAQVQKQQQIIPQSYAAIICYILAQDFNEITKIYFDSLKLFESGTLQRKLAAIEYARRLILIEQHLTVQLHDIKLFQKIVREVAFIALEEHEKILAHQLFASYSNAHKTIDYLVTNTKELQQYQASINHKPILLPLMQIKKQEKKNAPKGAPKGTAENKQPQQQPQQPQKPKVKIFDRQEQRSSPPPPPSGPPKKRVIEQNNQSSGFSPYDNQTPKQPSVQQPQPPPVKKNLNTPPPMPISSKKAIHIPQQEQEVKEIKRQVPSQPIKNIPAPIKKPPPPMPNQLNTSVSEDKQQYTPKPPTIPQKKIPPPAFQKPMPPPKQVIAVQAPQKQQYVQQVQQQEPTRIKPPPPQIKPQRPVETEKVEIPRREEPPQKKLAPRMPPPAKQQQQPKQYPPQKIEQRRQEQPQQEVVVKKTLPPPMPQPPKRNLPPPPVRK